MQPVRIIVAVAAATVMLGAAHWSQRQPSPPPRVTDSARAAHARREVVRLRAHFDSVDAELRARDVSRLTPAQRAARLELIAWLRDYRNAGRFPANDEPGAAPIPIFRDARRVLCAMAYLIDRSGRGDIVDHVARTRNTAYIRELADDTALVAWLDANGLTAAEAGRIQPQYGGPGIGTPADDDHVRASYALTSLGLGGVSLATGGVNVVAPSRTSGFLGLLSGTATLVTGAIRLDEDGGTHKLAVANTAVGVATIALGFRALLSSRLAPRSTDSFRTASAARTRRATITPALLSTGGPGDTQRLGMLVHASF
jgi:hypothetical protein